MLGILCLAVSCATASDWRERQKEEFRWDELPYYTLRHDIPVCLPCWLDSEDIVPVLDAVDRYWDLMEDNFPSAKEIDPGEYTIHIHDNPGAVLGWHSRSRVLVSRLVHWTSYRHSLGLDV
jgi:hypothetical protein